jgi:hypothetical protein
LPRRLRARGGALKIVLARSRYLLDIVLNHLTLGRAALYKAILVYSPFRTRTDVTPAAAVSTRLSLREAAYPWESPQHALAEARRLIEKHRYWRRKEEREDAEAAIGS